jgi:hypothetical protein
VALFLPETTHDYAIRQAGPSINKWNPFSPEFPTEALVVSPRLDHFGWRLEHLVREGGFALVTGDPGKSAALRLIAARLAALRDVVVGVIEHPQSGVSDFYRELGHLFGVSLAPAIAGAASRPCATSGTPTSRPRSCARCSSSTRRRRCPSRCWPSCGC